MGGHLPTSGEDDYQQEKLGREARDGRKTMVLAPQLLPQAPAASDNLHETRRRSGCPPVYWRGVDWRHEVENRLCSPFTPGDQGMSEACAGFAVAHAVRANVAIHRGENVELDPYLIWGLAREREQRQRSGRGGLLLEALYVVNNYGIPTPRQDSAAAALAGGLTAQITQRVLEFDPDGGRERANPRKIQGVVDLGCFAGDWSAWLHAFGPIAVRMILDREQLMAVTPSNPYLTYRPGLAYDGEVSQKYASHDVVVVGYHPWQPSDPRSDSFIVMNSYGPGWGEGGFAYITVTAARASFRAGFGILLREHLGYGRDGACAPQLASRLALR